MPVKTTKATSAKTAAAKSKPAKDKKTTKTPVAKTAATTKAKKPAAKKATAPKATKAKAPVAKVSKAKVKAAPVKAAKKEALGLPEAMRDAALKVLDAKKAEDVVAVELKGRSALADYAIIATGGSSRQLSALAEYVREAFFKLGVRKLRIEGVAQGDWVLIDAGDVVVHLFRAEVRSFYQLEEIWSAKSPTVG